jgi:hypothetical protein
LLLSDSTAKVVGLITAFVDFVLRFVSRTAFTTLVNEGVPSLSLV